jgi:hypothetical protein
MSVTLTTIPRKTISGAVYSNWNAVYNPYVFGFTFASIPGAATSLKVDCEILDKAGAVVSTHEAYADSLTSLKAWLDVSAIVQGMITDVSVYNEAGINEASLYAGFFVKYRESYYTSLGVLVQGSWTTSTKFFAVRGVRQIGESQNYYDDTHNLLTYKYGAMRSTTGEFLTMFTDYVLPVWAGYPRDIAFILWENSDDLKFVRNLAGVLTTSTITQDASYPGYVMRLEVSNNPGHTYPWTTVYLVDSATGLLSCSRVYTLQNMTTGSNPFYVRWRNWKGGWDYWMFEKRQELRYGSSDTKTVRRDITIFEDARSTHKVYRRTGGLSYLVGATSLTQVRWDALNSIRFSSRVEYWNGTLWQEIIPDDGENTLVNDKPAGEIEYLFVFPERQMAY